MSGTAWTRLAAIVLLTSLLPQGAVLADDTALIGTWGLTSFVRELSGTGERYNQLGERPEGVIGYSADGRMYVILLAGDRVRPQGEMPTNQERIALFKSMIAYGGTYTADDHKVVHHVDLSWNGARAGSDQVRFYTLEGDVLTIRTPVSKGPIDGREGVGILVFQRIK